MIKPIRVWDVQTGEEAWHIDNAHTDQIWSLMFSADDKWLASASFDKTAKIWDTTTHSTSRQDTATQSGCVRRSRSMRMEQNSS